RPWRNFFLTHAVEPRCGAIAMHKRSPAEVNRLVRENAPQQHFSAEAHHIHQYLHLTAALGAKPEPLPPRLAVANNAVDAFAAKFKLPAAPLFLGLNPGAEYGPAKRWPEARFIEAAVQIQRQTKCFWLIFGVKSDAEMAARIAAEISKASGQN